MRQSRKVLKTLVCTVAMATLVVVLVAWIWVGGLAVQREFEEGRARRSRPLHHDSLASGRPHLATSGAAGRR